MDPYNKCHETIPLLHATYYFPFCCVKKKKKVTPTKLISQPIKESSTIRSKYCDGGNQIRRVKK